MAAMNGGAPSYPTGTPSATPSYPTFPNSSQQDPGELRPAVGGGGEGGYSAGEGGSGPVPTMIPCAGGSLSDKLRVAASKGQVDKVQELLQAGAGMEPDRDGRTSLHYAAQNGYPEVCKMLIEKGCELDVQDAMGYTALLRASSQGLLDVVRVCLEAGCAVDFADEHGNTALHEAAWHGFSKTVQMLIQYNANVFRVNSSGFTALHLAAQNGHNESSRVLLYGGVNCDLQNNYGDTALHTAARYGHAGVTRILISAKCKLNLPNKNGDTALHIAAALKRRKIAKILAESHVDIHVRNKQNETAIDVARRKEHPEIILIITSLTRPHSAVPKAREVPGVTFKDDIEVEGGPVVCADDDTPVKSDKAEKEKRSFPFFWKKKKDKEKEKGANVGSTNTQAKRPIPPSKVQPVPAKPVAGFFSQYVPRTGTQYYRDLAGNIKQGPVGYTPVCQCGPALNHIEKVMSSTKEQLYDHIDASHQVLQDRIEQLDLRSSQQAHSLDKLTRERLEEERRACQSAIEERLQRERHHTQYVVETYGDGLQGQIQDWLEDRLASYGHCLDHHHDDSALPPRHIFTDVHLGPNGGRLFRSRSDETLSVSDCSGKGRKRQFYESRKAAMEQIRGWKVPTKESSSKRRERGRSADDLDRREARTRERNNSAGINRTPAMAASTGNVVTIAEVHKPGDRLADGASPTYLGEGATTRQQQQPSVQKHVGFGVADGRQTPSYGAIPKRSSYMHSQPHSRQSHTQLPSQSRSQGDLTYHPPGAPSGSTPTVSHHHPPPSQTPTGAQQPRRGILRSRTDDGTLNERARCSTRQQPNLEGRGPLDAGPCGPSPGGCGGPSATKSPASTGRVGVSVSGAVPQHNPLYGTAQSMADSTLGNSSIAPSHPDGGANIPRYRPRTGSVDTILDSGYGGVGANQIGGRVGAGDCSGYVTDSGMRKSYFDHSNYNHHSHNHKDSQNAVSGLWCSSNALSQSDDKGANGGGRYVSSDRSSGAVRSTSNDRPAGNVTVGSSPRPLSSDRNSGYYTDSEVRRSTQGQSLPFTASSAPYANQSAVNRQQERRQPASRYRVLPPLPPSSLSPVGDRTKPPVAPKPAPRSASAGAGGDHSVYDRTSSQTPLSRDPVTHSNVVSGKKLFAQNSDRFAHLPGESGSGGGGGSYQNYNHGASPPHPHSVHPGQDRPGAHRTNSPRGQRDNSQAVGKDRSAHRSTSTLYNPALQLNNSGNHARTPSPYQNAAVSGRNSVCKSESSLNRDSNQSSPREPASSGHYSVTNGCLRHDAFSYSPVYKAGGSKEDSTCSSNQDSGYSSRMVGDLQGKGLDGGGRSAESTTPSSSFSTDRSVSLGPPSNTSSPYLYMGGGNSYNDYVPMGNHSLGNSFRGYPNATHTNTPPSYSEYQQKAGSRNTAGHQPSNRSLSQQPQPGNAPGSQVGGGSGLGINLQKQVQGWYQQKLLEAAQRLRNSEQYSQTADTASYSNYASIPIRYDPVHGSDV